jgi:hypothetical protein
MCSGVSGVLVDRWNGKAARSMQWTEQLIVGRKAVEMEGERENWWRGEERKRRERKRGRARERRWFMRR